MTDNQIIILLEAYKYDFTEKGNFNDYISCYWINTVRSLHSKGFLEKLNRDVYKITDAGVQELRLELSREDLLNVLLTHRGNIRSIMNRWFR